MCRNKVYRNINILILSTLLSDSYRVYSKMVECILGELEYTPKLSRCTCTVHIGLGNVAWANMCFSLELTSYITPPKNYQNCM